MNTKKQTENELIEIKMPAASQADIGAADVTALSAGISKVNIADLLRGAMQQMNVEGERVWLSSFIFYVLSLRAFCVLCGSTN
jgi:hypothetical protein